jgi:type VI secretion system Hcp family effector
MPCYVAKVLYTAILGNEMNILLSLPAVQGNVTLDDYHGWIQLLSADFNVDRNIHTTPGQVRGRNVGLPNWSELTFTKKLDEASRSLFTHACNGKVYDQVKLHLCTTGGATDPYVKHTLSKVIVAHMQTIMHDNAQPLELVRLNFTQIETTHITYDASGHPQAPHVSGYDVERATAL